jgi:outer membrane protein assembly factor BamE (lipoprotein component of BamABCDE complex)
MDSMRKNIMPGPAGKLLPTLFLAAAAAACSPRIDVRGNLPNPDQLALVKPGDVNRDDVAAMLGTPSSTALFDDETWYYISSKTETVSFLSTKELERRIVAISFDKNGTVKAVRELTLQDGKVVKPVERETPTAGNEMTVLEQLFGNIGRFSKGTEDSGGRR